MVIICKLIKLKQVLHTLSIFQRCSTGCLVFLEIWTDIEVEFLAHCQHIDLGCAVEDLGKADVVGLVVGIWNGNHIYYAKYFSPSLNNSSFVSMFNKNFEFGFKGITYYLYGNTV